MTVEKVFINSPFIKLDQFLKWAGITGSGSEAKSLIESGKVTVNQIIEKKRGRKLYPGDNVSVLTRVFQIGIEQTEGPH